MLGTRTHLGLYTIRRRRSWNMEHGTSIINTVTLHPFTLLFHTPRARLLMSSTNKSFVLIRAEEAKGRANPAIPQMIPNGIRLQGWTVSAQRTHISLSTEIEQLAKEMNAALMPEMAYLHNYLQFEHKGTGMVLRFDAKDALKTCRLNSGSVDADQPPDWTFRPIQYAGRMMFLDRDTGKESAVIVRKDPNAKINMELLQRRDPILYYEDVVLYEDELHDIGHCSLSVKTVTKIFI